MRRLFCLLVCSVAGSVFAQGACTAATSPARTPGQGYVRDIAEPELSDEARVAGSSVFGLSLVDDLSVPAAECEVRGLRLNLLTGRHRNVYGLDVGLLANVVSSESKSVSVAGAFNSVARDFHGIQLAAGFNAVGRTLDGVQVAMVNDVVELDGLQLGLVNVTDCGRGFQLGVVNYASRLSGMQVGLFNVIETSNAPYMPIVNFAF